MKSVASSKLSILTAAVAVAMLTGCNQQTTTSGESEAPKVAPSGTWMLTQRSDVSGPQTSWLSADVARVNIKLPALTYVIKKNPGWNAYVFNDKLKVIYEAPIEEFDAKRLEAQKRQELLDKELGLYPEQTPYVKVGTERIGGINTTIWESTTNTHNPVAGGTNTSKTTMWVTEELPHPHGIATVPSTGTENVPKEAMVLRMVVETNGKKIFGMDTTACEQVPLPPNVYDVPSGYKKVSDEVDAIFGEGTTAKMLKTQKDMLAFKKAAAQNQNNPLNSVNTRLMQMKPGQMNRQR
jgi:hypothetical protein